MGETWKQDRQAISHVGHIVLQLDWMWREQPILDYGIDGQIEICDIDKKPESIPKLVENWIMTYAALVWVFFSLNLSILLLNSGSDLYPLIFLNEGSISINAVATQRCLWLLCFWLPKYTEPRLEPQRLFGFSSWQ